MILLKNAMNNDFIIKIHGTMILLYKWIGQWFYYKNALDNDFVIKMKWTMILL